MKVLDAAPLEIEPGVKDGHLDWNQRTRLASHRGGVIGRHLPQTNSPHPSPAPAPRHSALTDEKERTARLAPAELPDEGSILLDAGTATARLAAALPVD